MGQVTTFSASSTSAGGTTTLHIAGELDMATAEQMRELGDAALDDRQCRTLVLDAAELSFLDSSGLSCWMELRRRAVAGGQRVVVRSAQPQVLRILDVAGLTNYFDEGSETNPS